MNDSAPAATVSLDPENPWLGLDSYTEATRAYFHGRDEETAELARRVQGKNLTILFGQSGLGKTSLLRAGVVPRLRPEGYCPVYVRIDYAPGSPAPAEQIKRAIFRATEAAGVWARPGSAVEGESLWEFLHHRGDLLRDADGKPLLPLLIFDQFEEIFTLGQADDAGRERAKEFLAELADLVENRAPQPLEQRLETDDSIVDNFDFARADYRVLIALREDYLAHLESLKGTMPSITQNRMRLARMTGAQALAAVLQSGGKLVTREVAEAIVRFVAGGSELANAEIEPSLLSLVCRELNNARIAQGRGEISADLLAGSRNTILSEFYERALADQPDGVRRVIEDELLTESGYRESLAEERVLKALAEAGAAPDALAMLVNRRLLRIEERLDMRRVELTHDVLCSVVLASREQRHAREMREQAKRQLAEQQAREQAAHRALLRARLIAAVCLALMLVAIAGALFGWYSFNRAQAAEAQAQKSRSDAENLVSFMIEDFYNQLAPTGRLETLGALAAKTVAYYDTLPPGLVTRRTRINRAMALTREGSAQQDSGKFDDADKSLGQAQAVFKQMYDSGDHGEAVTYGLALALQSQGGSIITGGRGTPAQVRRAADLLRPLVYGKDPSRRVRQLYGDTLNVLSHTQPLEQGVKTCEEARKVLAGLGAIDLSDLDAASSYADTADSESRELLALGRIDEAWKLQHQVYDIAEKLLARRPGDLHARLDRFLAAELLGQLAFLRHDPAAAADYAQRAAQAGEELVRFNPSNLDSWRNWALGLDAVAYFQAERGDLEQAIATRESLQALERDPRRPSSLGPTLVGFWTGLAVLQAQTGDSAGAARSLQGFERDAGEADAQMAPDDPRLPVLVGAIKGPEAVVQLLEGNAHAALATATTVLHNLDAIDTPAGSRSPPIKDAILGNMLGIAAEASILTGDYARAESFARRLRALPPNNRSESDPRSRTARASVVLADAVARQGRSAEAEKILQPALDWYRGQQQAGAAGVTFRQDFAYALYVEALAGGDGRSRRNTDLAEAATLIDTAPGEARNTVRMRQLAGWIAAARKSAK
ncbi:MAG TPA: hypothetical protein VFY97_10610 [Rhodanobacteraceae bacterium]|nr:hypothetical protein [Rhodanobacteraceae bacterium]